MDDFVSFVIKEYELIIKSFHEERGFFVLNTANGQKCLKKTNLSQEKINFADMVKENLYKKGMENTDRYIKSVHNRPFITYKGQKYTMTNYFPYENSNFRDINQALPAAANIAKFHLLSEGVKNFNLKFEYIPDLYKKRIVEFKKIKKWAGKRSRLSDLDAVFLKNYYAYLDYASRALNELEQTKYYDYLQTNGRQKISHNNIKEETVKIMDGGNIYLTQFDYCSFDYYIKDLADILRRYMKSDSFKVNGAFNIVASYNNVNTISEEDLKIIKALIAFPEKYFKICSEYYNKRKNFISSSFLRRFENSMDILHKQEKLLKEL